MAEHDAAALAAAVLAAHDRLVAAHGESCDCETCLIVQPLAVAALPVHPPAPLRVRHGRHCPCSACAREDWTNPDLAPCDYHGVQCAYDGQAAPPAPLPLDAQFFAVDKSLLMTFQWSKKEYERFGLAAHGFLRHLHDIGWDVTVNDPAKAAEYARLATPESTDVAGVRFIVDDRMPPDRVVIITPESPFQNVTGRTDLCFDCGHHLHRPSPGPCGWYDCPCEATPEPTEGERP